MEYFDEEILDAKRELERLKHTTLETGIYVEDELLTFTQVTLPSSKIRIYLPEQFIVMPDMVKDMKYPSKNAPDFIVTSLDSMVNFCFNIFPVLLEKGDTKVMSSQFQNALQNVNPSIKIKNIISDIFTAQGNEMSWFEYKGYTLDGQNYNRMYIVRMRKTVLHGIFNCPMRVKEQWSGIVEKCFLSVEEEM
ncbi:hypothetical protein FMM75_21045 [Lachnospiraceae bacterium MD335]|jgi:hypothetical protein|nr:hypothetical protein C809_04182 [Lachnospiraceae bacterium MD335]NDO51757.1 hypothetical protein [Lachnospiraceae bacterium MD335]